MSPPSKTPGHGGASFSLRGASAPPCCLLLTLFLTTVLHAQQADVSGIIKDSSGAAVPRAGITLLHQQSGIRRQAQSDEHGLYAIPAARPGAYRISVRKPGFQTSARSISINTGQSARYDFTLTVGPVEDSVTINDRKPQQPPDDAATGTTLRRRMVENLPNNGRSLLPLIEAAPGVIITPAGGGEVGQFAVNGQRSNANYITVDGVSSNFAVNDGLPGQAPSGSTPVLTALGSMQTVVSVEALEEVHVRTSTTPAEFGRLPGGQISMTTRAGTNQFHGSAFEYLRNEKLDANNWFSNSAGLRRSPLRSNDFGASLGGPLWKDKTFFFASYEGLHLRQPFTLRDSVPSNAFRQQAPPIVRDFLDAYPIASGPPTSADMAELTAAVSRPSALNASSIRVDHNLNDKAQFFVRAYDTPSSAQGSAASLYSQGQLNLGARGFTAGLNSAFSARTLNDLRFGYASAQARYGVTPIISNPNANVWRILPPVTPAASTNYEVLVYGLQPVVGSSNDRHTQSQWNLVDSLTHIRGKHEWKLGGDFRLILPSLESHPYGVYASFDSLTSLALGHLSQFTINHQDPLSLTAKNLSMFVQDTYRVRPNLTFNLGLRWEWNPPMTGRSGDTLTPVVNLGPAAHLAAAPLWHNNAARNFAPRVGLAWRPFENRNLTIRSGAGVYYDLGYGVAMSSLASSAPYFTSSTIYDVSIYDPTGAIRLPNASPPYARGFAYQPGFQLPNTFHWNVGIEQQLGRAAAISATYVNLTGNNLLRREWLAHPNASFTGVDVTTNGGFSGYSALQLQLRSRMETALQYLFSFNWSRSTDNASKDSQLLPYGDQASRAADLGYSDFDVRRSWNASVSYEPKSLKNWALESIIRSRSAFPLNVVTGADPFQFGNGNYVLRPNLVAGTPIWISDSNAPGGERLNANAFSVPNGYTQGDLTRNSIRGFGFSQVDIAVRKQFNVREGSSIQLRVEVFNAFNHANLSDPQTSLNSAQFGQSQSMLSAGLGTGGPANGLMPVFQIGGPRSLQASLRFRF